MIERGGAEARIRSASFRLERALAPIEAAFLEAGGQLAGVVHRLGQLTEGFTGLASRLEHPDSVAALSALEEISRRVGALSGGSRASRDRLEAMHGRAASLDKRIARLRKVIAEVRVLAVNAKVEAAHVTVSGIDFTVFTREIGRLADLAGDKLDQLADDVAGLIGDMAGARAGLDAFGRDHRQSLGTVGERLAQGLASASARKRQSAAAIRDLGDVARHMAAEVAQAVEALQVGDITRQRAEHVREALATLLDVLGGEMAALPADHKPVLIATVSRLQSAQAMHAGEELRQELARIRTNVQALIADLERLPDQCAAVTGGSDGGSFLLELGRELEEVHQLLRRYSEARAGVERVFESISAVVEGMVRHIEGIRSIEADMRVMGLNATFKCARLGGQGRALSVIAQELRGYSNRTAEEGKAIMGELTELIAAARDMGEDERRGHAADGLEAEMAAAVARLETMGQRSSRTLAELDMVGREAIESLHGAARLLDAHPEFVAALAECGTVIGQVAADAGEISGDIDSIRDEVLELLRGRYTMASERKVHEMFGGGGPEAASEAAPPDADDFLF